MIHRNWDSSGCEIIATTSKVFGGYETEKSSFFYNMPLTNMITILLGVFVINSSG